MTWELKIFDCWRDHIASSPPDSLLSSCCPSREACCSRPRKLGRLPVRMWRRGPFCHTANKPPSTWPSRASARWRTWRGAVPSSWSNSLSLDCREGDSTLKTAQIHLQVCLDIIGAYSVLQSFIFTCRLNSTRRCCKVLILSNSLFRIWELRYWIRACEHNNMQFFQVPQSAQ